MAGIKRTTPDDHSPNGLHQSAKRSKSSLVLRAAPPTPVQVRPLQQRTGGWFNTITALPGVAGILKGFGLLSQSETPTRSSPLRTPRAKSRGQEGGGQRISICGPNQSRHRQLYPPLPNEREVIDMTREADEQSDIGSLPGPSRQSNQAYGNGRQDTLPDLGRLTLGGQVLAGQSRRRERNRKWDRDVESDEEEHTHPSRSRPKEGIENPSIPVMEEQLARYRKIEGQAEIDGDEVAEREARKTAQHFERALKDAKAKRDSERAQEVVYSRREGGSLIDYQARLAAIRQPQTRPGQLFGSRKVEAPVLGRTQRTPIPSFKQSTDITELLEKVYLDKEKEDEKFRKLSGPSIPTSLSPEELVIVKKTLTNPSFKSTMVGNEQVDNRNIGRLQIGKWLADDNISYYLALVSARNASNPKYPKIHVFNTFFYGKIEAGGQKAVKRWTRKIDIFSKDLILVPINVGGMHWIAATINMNKKRIEYFDSMGSYGSAMRDVSENLIQYVQDEHLDKKGSPYDTSDWTYKHGNNAPRQDNGSDCGVFTCQTLELVARGLDPIDKGFEFTHQNMPFFRDLMVYETATGKLKKRW